MDDPDILLPPEFDDDFDWGSVDDDVLCTFCRKPVENRHDHHTVPKSEGGTVTVPVCDVCHRAHHSTNGDFSRWGKRGWKALKKHLGGDEEAARHMSRLGKKGGAKAARRRRRQMGEKEYKLRMKELARRGAEARWRKHKSTDEKESLSCNDNQLELFTQSRLATTTSA